MTERARATASRAASDAADSAAATCSTLGLPAASDFEEAEAGADAEATDALAIEPPACSSATANARSNCLA